MQTTCAHARTHTMANDTDKPTCLNSCIRPFVFVASGQLRFVVLLKKKKHS